MRRIISILAEHGVNSPGSNPQEKGKAMSDAVKFAVLAVAVTAIVLLIVSTVGVPHYQT